jgi:hypothetical protein
VSVHHEQGEDAAHAVDTREPRVNREDKRVLGE